MSQYSRKGYSPMQENSKYVIQKSSRKEGGLKFPLKSELHAESPFQRGQDGKGREVTFPWGSQTSPATGRWPRSSDINSCESDCADSVWFWQDEMKTVLYLWALLSPRPRYSRVTVGETSDHLIEEHPTQTWLGSFKCPRKSETAVTKIFEKL